ncbi:MAG: FxsA family protein [Desulfohalobiaceae bacterium]
MLGKLILAFALLPVLEIYVLIEVGSVIGSLNTVAIILLTAVAGGYLARSEGSRTYYQIQNNLNQGIIPRNEIIDALLIFGAGVVLLTPGFVTDLAGLTVLFPPTRAPIREFLKRRFKNRMDRTTIEINRF